MRHQIFAEENSNYGIAILMKATAFNKNELQTNYVIPLHLRGINCNSVIAFTLEGEPGKKKPSASFMKDYLAKLLRVLDSLSVKHLYVADGEYFKLLAGQRKAEPHFGYALPCRVPHYEHMTVVLGVNYQALIYNPELQAKVDLSLKTLADSVQGTYQAIGTGIIHSAQYPDTTQEIADALARLHQHPRLTADIEGFSLRFEEAGIGSIAFAWDHHNGIAFCVDWKALAEPADGLHGAREHNRDVRRLLLEFFTTYRGELIWHNGCGYDIKVLIAQLWMADLLDTSGLLEGLEVMTRRVHDTKIIAYLATNSTAGNVLGLKSLAHEFAGNWAVEEIKDIRRLPKDKLLQYNLVDALSGFYVFEKYWPRMVADQQLEIYQSLFLPSAKVLIQTELTGMPMSRRRIQEVKAELQAIEAKALNTVNGSPVIQVLNQLLQETAWQDDLAERRAKAKNPEKIKEKPKDAYADLTFNPNSGPQLQRLLYEVMGLPVLDLTDTKQPATGAETIEKLINHTQDASHKEVLQALIEYAKVNKILGTFIAAFEQAISKDDSDTVWLHGSFNLGGTVSGRLSSSDPNMQNLPSGSDYGKLIKSCFVAPKGWLFIGADFNALEDRINTLLTRDPNKVKVFTQGYDSHCLRAFYFFPDRLPGIVDTVESINSIKKAFPTIRQDAKSPAFALQYLGTWRTLVKNLGFEESVARRIEAGFNEMYKVSKKWVGKKIEYAAKHGYVDLAFGLRLRTPLLQQVVWGSGNVPTAAEAEARTLGNAVSGQSYGLLNNRAANEFMGQVWKSEHRLDILPVAQIHDAQYALVRDDVTILHWVNQRLPAAMAWQELPEIQHPEVHLGAEIDVHYKGWHQPITIPNDATPAEMRAICQEGAKKYDEKLQKMRAAEAAR